MAGVGAGAIAIGAALVLHILGNSVSAPTTAAVQLGSPDYGSVPLSFQPNRGQSDRTVRFLSTGAGYGLFLTDHGVVLDLQGPDPGASDRVSTADHGSVISMSLVDAGSNPQIDGQSRLPGRVNYLGGDGSRSETAIPTYSAVHYGAVWPGVGMRFYGNQGRLEYDFELAPGADPAAIGLRFSGQRRLQVDRAGGLALSLGGSTIHQLRPHAYQLIAGARRPVASHYVSRNGKVGIVLGAYDHRRAVTIDPQLVYSTYLGRGIDGRGFSIAVDSAGNAYITGYTFSPKFPTTRGAFQTSMRGSGSLVAFVTKLNRSGSGIVYSTYLGGQSGSEGSAIAVDRAGDAYLTGLAYSPGFPTTKGSFQEQALGFENAFIAKLNPSGSRLLYSTYLGGRGEGGGVAGAIAINRAGDAYVAGYTSSSEFPTTPGAVQSAGPSSGGTKGFVTELNPSGSGLLYSTYLGGSGEDVASGIAVDAAGNAYVTGRAGSRDFPITPGAFQTTNHAPAEFSNAFVTKLDPIGSRFIYSTYLGGSGLDYGTGIAVDPSGEAHVTGEAGSPDFPTTAGAFQRHIREYGDAFVSTLSPNGRKLLSSTFLGGEGRGRGIALDQADNIYVSGLTDSKHFPTTPGALQRKIHSKRGYSGFLTKLNPAGTRLLYSTYLGGQGARASSIALDRRGTAYLTGGSGPGFPVTRHGVPQTYRPPKPSYPNAFVVKLSP